MKKTKKKISEDEKQIEDADGMLTAQKYKE